MSRRGRLVATTVKVRRSRLFFVAVACRDVAAASVEGFFQASGVDGQRRARIGGRWSFLVRTVSGIASRGRRWRKEATKIKDGQEENRNRWVQ